MKNLPLVLLISALSVPGLASPKLKLKENFDNDPMSAVQCSKLAEDLDSKLQGLAISEGLPRDTFSVRTKMDFRRSRRHRTVEFCVSHFKSQNPNYGFLKNEGINRHGPGRDAQCQLDLQNLENQDNNLGVAGNYDFGFSFHPACAISSISLQKVL